MLCCFLSKCPSIHECDVCDVCDVFSFWIRSRVGSDSHMTNHMTYHMTSQLCWEVYKAT